MLTSKEGQQEIVKLLEDHSDISTLIELNVRTSIGKTPFMLTCKHGHLEVVKLQGSSND